MKKFVIILLAACLILGCAVGYFVGRDRDRGEPVVIRDPEPAAEPAEEPESEPAEESAAPQPEPESVPESEPAEESAAPAITIRALDYEAIRALHEPDEVVGSVGGREVRWDEYFYWLHSVGVQTEQYVQTLALYGQSLDWNDKLSSDSDTTLAGYVIEMAQEYSGQLNVIEAVAEENKVSLTPENEAEIAENLRQTIEGACGEGATEEDFNALLAQEMISREMYDRLERANYLYQNTFIALYGRDGEKVPQETALAFLRDNSYLCASHILFATRDLESGEAVDDAAAAEKLQQAEAVSAELRAIKDPKERAARFAALKEQYCEDTGKVQFPEGYLFLPGAMVPEFEEGVKALGEYQVSEPVLSGYGYHVIMRLPLSAEMTMDYSEAGTPLDARAVYANEQFNIMMSSRIETSAFVLRDGAAIELTDYLK